MHISCAGPFPCAGGQATGVAEHFATCSRCGHEISVGNPGALWDISGLSVFGGSGVFVLLLGSGWLVRNQVRHLGQHTALGDTDTLKIIQGSVH